MNKKNSYTIINKQNGNLAFKLIFFTDNSHFDYFQRNNFHTIVIINDGNGYLKTSFIEQEISTYSVFAFAPYQPFMIKSSNCKGIAIQFHSDFFCIHKHHREVTCNGILFNNVHQLPVFKIDEKTFNTFDDIIKKIILEIQSDSLAQYEMLISYLKIILITTSRIKSEQIPITNSSSTNEPDILQKLKELIEANFKTAHFSEYYAGKLFITKKNLSNLIKKHYCKTFTQLFTERVLIEAKRELYLTNKTVKEISSELGYNDEHYFSRFFKKNVGITTQQYRETVGFGKEES